LICEEELKMMNEIEDHYSTNITELPEDLGKLL
jgi:hypothetical protein